MTLLYQAIVHMYPGIYMYVHVCTCMYMYIICVCYVTAVDCGDPVDINHSTHEHNTTIYLSDVAYTCDTAYWFSRDTFSRISQCSSSAEWTDAGECTGERAILYCAYRTQSDPHFLFCHFS